MREPRGELADGEQLLAVALDPLDRPADRLERRQELAQQRRVRIGEAAQLVAVELEDDRVADGERAAAVRRLGEQRHRPEVAAGPVAHEQDLLAGDLARRLELALEDDVERARPIALAEQELPLLQAPLAPGAGEPDELLVVKRAEDLDLAQAVGGHRTIRGPGPHSVDPNRSPRRREGGEADRRFRPAHPAG